MAASRSMSANSSLSAAREDWASGEAPVLARRVGRLRRRGWCWESSIAASGVRRGSRQASNNCPRRANGSCDQRTQGRRHVHSGTTREESAARSRVGRGSRARPRRGCLGLAAWLCGSASKSASLPAARNGGSASRLSRGYGGRGGGALCGRAWGTSALLGRKASAGSPCAKAVSRCSITPQLRSNAARQLAGRLAARSRRLATANPRAAAGEPVHRSCTIKGSAPWPGLAEPVDDGHGR